MNFSERLKKLRKEAGFTQVEISEKLGLRQSAYSKYERGTGKPLNANLEKLASIFDVSVSYLLGETDVRLSSDFMEQMANLSETEQEEVLKFLQKQRNNTSTSQEKNS